MLAADRTFTSDIQILSSWDFSMASLSFLYQPEPFVSGIVTEANNGK